MPAHDMSKASMKLKRKTTETSMEQWHVMNFVVPERRIKEDGRYTQCQIC
jgi:hypothetical protein